MTQSGQNRGMGKYFNGNILRNVIHHNKKYTFKWFLQHFVIDQRVLDGIVNNILEGNTGYLLLRGTCH